MPSARPIRSRPQDANTPPQAGTLYFQAFHVRHVETGAFETLIPVEITDAPRHDEPPHPRSCLSPNCPTDPRTRPTGLREPRIPQQPRRPHRPNPRRILRALG